KGADPNFIDPDDFTPLYVAVKHGLDDCARLLVERGAMVTKATATYTSPLQLAIQTNNKELTKFFLEKLTEIETLHTQAKQAAHQGRVISGKRRRTEESNGAKDKEAGKEFETSS